MVDWYLTLYGPTAFPGWDGTAFLWIGGQVAARVATIIQNLKVGRDF